MVYGTSYKIIDRQDGGTFNHITQAPDERASDSIDVVNEKRLRYAITLMQRWWANFNRDLQLTIVPCR